MAALLGAAALWSCTADEAESRGAGEGGLPTTISLTTRLTATRAASDPQASAINGSVLVGVFGVSGTATVTNGDNGCYTVESTGSLTPKSKKAVMGWPADGSKVSIYAYAPYNSTWTHSSANSFTISGDQSSDEGYLASDLLYGVPASNPVEPTAKAVALAFTHKLAKVNIAVTIKEGSTIDFDLTKARVTINNTKPTTSLNPSTGALGAASGDATDIIATTALGSASTVYTIVVPQAIAKNTILATIETNPTGADNRTYRAKLKQDVTFESGKAYSFKVILDEDPEPALTLQMGGTSINGWNDNGGVSTTTKEVPSIGDYILADGKFSKTKQASAIAVIFSTTSHDADYEGYAVSLGGPLTGRKWGAEALIGTAIAGSNAATWISNALADYSGLATTTAVQAIDSYASTYTAFDFSTCPDVSGVTNLSRWFMPSFGQMIDIVQNLGGVSDVRTTMGSLTGTNDAQISADMTFISTINGYKVTNDIITSSSGGNTYITTSENSASNVWILKMFTDKWQLSRQAGKTGGSRYVLPVIAYKVPTE